MNDELGPVIIGAREIYNELRGLSDDVRTVSSKVDRVDSKVDHVATAQAEAHIETTKDLSDHEGRIRALERGRWPLPSLAALLAIGSLIVAIVSLLGKGA